MYVHDLGATTTPPATKTPAVLPLQQTRATSFWSQVWLSVVSSVAAGVAMHYVMRALDDRRARRSK